MIDRHAVKQMLMAGVSVGEVARHFEVSGCTIERMRKEPPVEGADDGAARRSRGLGRPGVAPEVRRRLGELIVADPEAPPLELLRQLREEGVGLGERTFYRLHRLERQALAASLMVRFEGVAGEFAQFDFGEVDVRLLDGRRKRVHFAAYRLKYSRWVSVVLVPDERVESLVRALLASFEASGGVPLRVVFDRPKTVVVGRERDGRPIWNQTLAQTVIDYSFTIELCAPRSPEQKGAVENLVGFVKRRFFRARRFADLEQDLPRQLLEWLVEVNEERPSRATGEIPNLRLAVELARMKPLRTASRAAGSRRRSAPPAPLPAGAHPRARACGRGLPDGTHPRPTSDLEGVERLFMLLEELGEAAFLRLLQRALFRGSTAPSTSSRSRPGRWPHDIARTACAARRPGRDAAASPLAHRAPALRRARGPGQEEEMSYRTYLEIHMAEEVAHRAQTRITRSVHKARFPFLRTIDEFDFTFQTSIRLKMLGTLLGPEFVSEGRCAIFGGPPGRGKTHLAVAVAYRAIQNGYEARIHQCRRAHRGVVLRLSPAPARRGARAVRAPQRPRIGSR